MWSPPALTSFTDHLDRTLGCREKMASSMQAEQSFEDGSIIQVIMNSYADRWLVLITQLSKVGNLVCSPSSLGHLHLPMQENMHRYRLQSQIQRLYPPSWISNNWSLHQPSISSRFWAVLPRSVSRRCTPFTQPISQP
jgi:hypothetical protein